MLSDTDSSDDDLMVPNGFVGMSSEEYIMFTLCVSLSSQQYL